DPKYPAMTARLDLTSRCTFRFHDCRLGLSNPGSTVCGARPAAVARLMALSNRIGPVNVRGIAKGGLALRPATMLVMGWSTKMPYAPRTTVLPFPEGSHAKPTRG